MGCHAGYVEVMIYSVFHWKPTIDRGLIMLPVGVYYNREIQRAKKGDYIVFRDCSREYRILDKCYIGLNTAAARLLCRYIYKYELDVVMRRWGNNAVIESNGRSAISDNKCLLIRYDNGSAHGGQDSIEIQ